MSSNADERKDPHGSLTIVGTGIEAVSQMTVQTIGYIREADVVFYHATNGVTASQIHALNANAVDLYEYYGEGKRRTATYVQMAELMLRQVRRGLNVVGVFHGHPGYFVRPARRALAIASMEGYPTALMAGISAPDCMFADLRIDPGVRGCQILMANHLFRDESIVAVNGHVVFLQVGGVGDRGFSFSGYKQARFSDFLERLIGIYGEQQEAVYYMAAIFPGCDPDIHVYKLADYRRPQVASIIRAGMLYVPPKGEAVASLPTFQAFRGAEPYRRKDQRLIDELDEHKTPDGFVRRRASPAVLEALSEVATTASARSRYRQDPNAFLAAHPDLSRQEREGLARRSIVSIRRVTATKL